MDFSELAERYGKSEVEIHNSVEDARRSLVPRTKVFNISEHGLQRKVTVTREGVGPLSTPYGVFHHFAFAIDDQWQKYSVLVMGSLDEKFNPVFRNIHELTLRIDSGCETGQLFGDRTCECRQQLHSCMRMLRELGEGLVINIPRQDGRGLGLPFKLATLRLQDELQVHTVEASALLDPDGSRDTRTYGGAIGIIHFFNIPQTTRLHLISNNPKKRDVFIENGYASADLIPDIIPPTRFTRHHLEAKQREFGHINLIADQTDKRIKQVNTSTGSWRERILTSIDSRDSRVCCGLDPDVTKLPLPFVNQSNQEDSLYDFIKQVIDLTFPYVCAYKVQKAFFDVFDGGKKLLRDVISYIHNVSVGTPVILDCKIGDIDNTMVTYLQTMFVDLNSDAVVISPYMGTDVWSQLRNYPQNAAFALVRTSNPGSALVQEALLESGLPVWEHILDLVLDQWRTGNNLMPILSAQEHIKEEIAWKIREEGVPTLIAGIGAQGGSVRNASELLIMGNPVLFNSSRRLLYPYDREDKEWRSAISHAVVELNTEINTQLRDRL